MGTERTRTGAPPPHPPAGGSRTLRVSPLLLVAALLALAPAPASAGGDGGRLVVGPASHLDGGRVDAPPDDGEGAPFPGLFGGSREGGGLTGPPATPEKPPDEPEPWRRSPEFTGNDDRVFAFQELDPARFADYLETCDGASLEERKAWHVGFTLSAWVMVGSDAEFDAAARDREFGPGAIAASNRLVVAFEQFAPDGRRFPDRVTKFGFEVDLFGNVYPCIGGADGGAGMMTGATAAEIQPAVDFPEIASCAVVLTSPVRRMCVNPEYKFEYKAGAKEPGRGAGPPAARLLQRWKRMFIHFYPAVGPGGLLRNAAGDPAHEPRYAVSIYPKRPLDPAAPRLTHFVDGAMLQCSRFPTPWTADKTLYLGPEEDMTGGYVIDTSLLPLNSEIPYETQ